MPDEASQAPAEVTQDTPANDSTESQAPTEIPAGYIPESRYKEAQAWGTRESQARAEYEQILTALRSDDPEVRNSAAEALGLEFEDDEDDEWTDPDEQRLSAIEKQQQKLAEHAERQEKSQQMEAYYEYVDGHLEKIEKTLGYELNNDDIRDLVGAAERLGMDQNLDEPDWAGATKWFQARQDALIERYKSTKRSQFVSPSGQAGSSKPNLENEEDRLEYFAALLQNAD